MNVIIANKFKDSLSNLNIDVIKRMDGEFEVETITETFTNFYFNRMILDITALKDHFNVNVMQKLIAGIDATKIILFLDNDPRINNAYLSQIISLGIYNFTRELSGVTYLMDNPNSYKDVAQYHELAAGNSGGFAGGNNNSPGMFNNNNNNSNNYTPPPPPPANNGFQNFSPEVPNNGQMAYGNQPAQDYNQGFNVTSNNTLVIGFKNLTNGAGSTSLIYMLKKQLKDYKVLAVEVNGTDFTYFNDPELVSATNQQINNVKNKFSQYEIVLVDINNSSLATDGTCNEVIYLLEPSTIKLNALMRRDRRILSRLKNNKIVLNKSMLSDQDVGEFSREAGVPIFFNLPPMDERQPSQMILNAFLDKLGVFRSSEPQNTASSPGGIFNIFRKS